VVLLVASAILGGELVFRHGVGVSERVGDEEDHDPELTPRGRADIGKS
jgi:hypothetical protein